MGIQRWIGFSMGLLLTSMVTVAAPFKSNSYDVAIEHVDGMVVADLIAGDGTVSEDVVLLGRNSQRQKQLQWFQLEQGKLQKPARPVMPLDDGVLFYDTGSIAGIKQQVLFFYLAGQVVRFDIDSGQLIPVIRSNSIYRPSQARTSALNPLKFLYDLNGDGLSDMVIADFDQSYVFMQQHDGAFATAQTIDMLAQRRLFDDAGGAYFSAKMYPMDFNFDGETDLVYRVHSQLYVFLQRQGVFTRQAVIVNLDLGTELLDEYDEFNKDQSDLVTHGFYDMIDLNKDGVMDIITQMTKSAGIFDKSSRYQVYFGYQKKGLKPPMSTMTAFKSQPDSIIDSSGMQFELTLVDFNADGQLDLVSPSYELGIGSIIASLFSSSADLQVSFHPLIGDQGYLPKPLVEKELTINFDLSSGQRVYPLMIIDDFNGDGKSDLLTGHNGKKLYLRTGVQGKRTFARRSDKFNIPLPRNGRLVTAKDLNADGQTDLIMRYDKLDGKDLSRQLKILMAN